MFWHKLKFGFWLTAPMVIGVFLAFHALHLFESDKRVAFPQTASVIEVIKETAIEIPEIKEPDFLTIVFGGDLMLDRGVRRSVEKNFAGDYAKLFENLGWLKDADLVFANLEGPASDQGRDGGGIYSFRMDPAVIPVLKDAGLGILSVANNHIGDWGRTAYIDTLERLKENGILYTGGGQGRAEAEAPAVFEKHGIKVGFLGFSDVGPNHMAAREDTAGQLLAPPSSGGVNEDPRFAEIIQNAASYVDFLIVSFHWGDEYKPIHNKRQEYLAHKAVDAGAKIVVGHHPHVIQDTEVYKDSFIAYSLGNFIFDQSWSAPTMIGAFLNIKLEKNGSMTKKIDTFKLNKIFQPDQIVEGAEEKI